jgi:uncharacterized radical SAM superfamily Fe-S cluster-containing enzyme
VNDVFIRSTLAWCTECGTSELARFIARPTGVWLERMCPRGVKRVKVAASYEWFLKRALQGRSVVNPTKTHQPKEECPKACGLCSRHQAELVLPVFSLTNDCNMDCPICFTFNRQDVKYYKSLEDTEKIFDHILKQNPEVQLVNMTGGEPTLHPQLPEIIALARSKGFERVTVNTNGIKIARSEEYAQMLKDSGAQMVLSLDTFSKEKSLRIHGMDVVHVKKQALQRMEALDIPTTILSVCIKNENEGEVHDFVQEYLPRDFICSITIQNMTYTGANGSQYGKTDEETLPKKQRPRITIDEVEELLSDIPGIHRDDFFTPGGTHPLCYSVGYYLAVNGRLISLTRIVSKELLEKNTLGCYHIHPDREFSEAFLEGVNDLWAQEGDSGDLQDLKQIFRELHPSTSKLEEKERSKRIERMIKMLIIHPHMDEDTFDIDRVKSCGDLVPDEQGRMIPACSYNLLYRQQDERFWYESANDIPKKDGIERGMEK